MTITGRCMRNSALLACLLLLLSLPQASAGEKVTVKLPTGQTTACDVLKMSKDGVGLRPSGGTEQLVPLERLSVKEVSECYKQATLPQTAAARFELGDYFFKKHLFSEAEQELAAAVKLDEKLRAKAEAMMIAIVAMKEMDKPKANKDEKDNDKPVKIVRVGEDGKVMELTSANDGDDEDFEKKFSRRERPARTPAQMKEFLDKRMEELKTIGGTWRLIETKHYYCFSNVPEAKHKIIAQWNEGLYDRLCQVLKHKEGDKLWNNKMPIYYFERYGQFQRFAAEIDKSPGAAYSGGYFAAEGRDVHICIPFMTERFNSEKRADRMARNTLHHECTHAFLQLTGEDVQLNRWLHEGLAQFIEFWYDRENNPDMRENNPERKERATYIQQLLAKNYLPTWEKMKNRPMSGMDIEGYAFAWTKLEFLYRNFDNQKLPQMIKLIKSGKSEDEAMQQAFGFPVQKLEEGYRIWVKANAKNGFKFE
ncbi:MAG TPA: hypothetical protein VEK08_03325 [Planctomycetota bacterium]|nr:hypothetical protein [Planctomycetota bacterium]